MYIWWLDQAFHPINDDIELMFLLLLYFHWNRLNNSINLHFNNFNLELHLFIDIAVCFLNYNLLLWLHGMKFPSIFSSILIINLGDLGPSNSKYTNVWVIPIINMIIFNTNKYHHKSFNSKSLNQVTSIINGFNVKILRQTTIRKNVACIL